MKKFDLGSIDDSDVKFTQDVPNGNLRSERWGSLRAMYRELQPDVTYSTFHARVSRGWDPVTAATKPRDPRGRRRPIPQQS